MGVPVWQLDSWSAAWILLGIGRLGLPLGRSNRRATALLLMAMKERTFSWLFFVLTDRGASRCLTRSFHEWPGWVGGLAMLVATAGVVLLSAPKGRRRVTGRVTGGDAALRLAERCSRHGSGVWCAVSVFCGATGVRRWPKMRGARRW
ncbi:MAG: hypothetical protein IPJ18_00005 [Betaproteobacteria bacterium]|nr:hypothetical protein [Betaproteobacteria bacterium]